MRNTVDRFNGRHQDYQAARPSYAQEFLDWLGELYLSLIHIFSPMPRRETSFL